MKISSLLIASAIAGTIMALLSNLPLIAYGNCLACLWLWTSGIFGSWLYWWLGNPRHSITAGQGAVVGVLSGIVGAIAGTIISAILAALGFASLTTSQADSIEKLFFGEVSSIAIIISLLINVFLYPIFGAIGGAIGGVIFGKSNTTS